MRAWRLAFALALLVQIWALYTPRPPSVDTGGLPVDKVAHVGLFLVVTWLGLRAGIPRRWLVPLMLLQAAASELVQLYVLPSRGGDWADFAADVIGITVALLLHRERPHSAEGLPDTS